LIELLAASICFARRCPMPGEERGVAGEGGGEGGGRGVWTDVGTRMLSWVVESQNEASLASFLGRYTTWVHAYIRACIYAYIHTKGQKKPKMAIKETQCRSKRDLPVGIVCSKCQSFRTISAR
jgi:hypothetical protein